MAKSEVRDPSTGRILYYTEAVGDRIEVRDGNGNMLGFMKNGETRDKNGNLVCKGEAASLLYKK